MTGARTDGAGLRVERQGRAATLVLERPPLQVLDLALLAALDRATAELAGDETVQVVVVRSADERAFSAGVAVEDHAPERLDEMLDTFHRSLLRLSSMDPVTLAAVAGHCLGGGMELALACDLVVADETARFAQPEVKLGCFPPFAAALYPRLLGRGRTLDLLLTGRVLTATQAEGWGLVQRLAPAGELDRAVERLVEEVLAQSPAVTPLIKRAVGTGTTPLAAALEAAEGIYRHELASTRDMREGLAAFLAKRPPSWQGR